MWKKGQRTWHTWVVSRVALQLKRNTDKKNILWVFMKPIYKYTANSIRGAHCANHFTHLSQASLARVCKTTFILSTQSTHYSYSDWHTLPSVIQTWNSQSGFHFNLLGLKLALISQTVIYNLLKSQKMYKVSSFKGPII